MNKNFKPLLISFFFWFLLDFILQLNIHRSFTLIDDHTIIAALDYFDSQGTFNYFKEIINDSGRFRPLLGIHRIFYAKLFGTNIQLIGYYYLVLAGITTFTLYGYFKLLGLKIIEATVITLFIMFGMQGIIWWSFDSAEYNGMLFFSIVLFSGHKCFESRRLIWLPVFWISIILMSISKESFIFVLPFLMILFRKNKIAVGGIFLIFLIELIYLKFFLGTTYGTVGVDNSSYSFYNLLKVFVQYLIRGYGIPFLILSGYLIYDNRGNLNDFLFENKINILIYIVGVLPFLLIYSKSGLNVGRYLYPLLIPQFLVFYYFLKQVHSQRIKNLLFLITMVLFTYHSFKFFQIQKEYANENIRLTRFYSLIKNKTRESEKILLLANPTEDFEKAGALMSYFHSKLMLNRGNAKMDTVQISRVPIDSPINNSFMGFYKKYLKEIKEPEEDYKYWIVINDEVLKTIKTSNKLKKPFEIFSEDNYSILIFQK